MIPPADPVGFSSAQFFWTIPCFAMKILDFLSQTDDASNDAASSVSRRDALNKIGQAGAALAAAMIPFGLASRSTPVRAQSMPSPVDILNYALTLEYLEASFYRQGLDATTGGSNLIPGDARTIYGKIADHEDAHVQLLADVINDLGDTPVEFADSDFDFTAGGTFDPFNDYATYLVLSQAFEDTGVRAYKGQAGFLVGNDLLTPALQIHSVEARHAAEVRRLRAEAGVSGLKPWITGSETGGAPDAVYAGEDNITQAGVDQTTLGNYTVEQATEAYDESLTMDAVAGENGIATPFFA